MTTAVVWFRRDLSLIDNPAFLQATSFDEVACVWVHESALLSSAGPFRRAHLFSALQSLEDEVALRGGHVTILSGPATEAIPRFARDIGASRVFWNADVSGFAQRRDAAVVHALERAGIPITTSWGTLVQQPGSIVTAAGTVPRIFKSFYDRWSALPVPPPVTDGGAALLDVASDVTPRDLGAETPAPVEGTADERLERFLTVVNDYEEARHRSDLDGTSHLSCDLRFGTISPRRVFRSVGTTTPGRRAFVRQMAWRDWFAHLFFERPELAHTSQQPAYDTLKWRNDPGEIEAWRNGRTGYPIVDAAMRELAATGWLHGRLRMVTSSFLVKDLLVDWRIGERHFRRLLIDGDVSANAGNWQWVAGTGPDAAPYFRILNPTTQGRRIDPAGDYVRQWIPELANLPGTKVHAPGECSEHELAAAGVELGVTYPSPVVDHTASRARALVAYSDARHARFAD